MKRVVLISFSLLILLCPGSSFAQLDTLRIATYNLLDFPDSMGSQRIDDFRKVIGFLKPDILVVQELKSDSGYQLFLNDVMNPEQTLYQAVPIRVPPQFLNNGLYYKIGKVQLRGVNHLTGNPRDISEYLLVAFGRDFRIFSVHFKAGSTGSDQISRLNQATSFRTYSNNLSTDSDFILAGDFNMRSSSESAFIELTESQADNDGRLFDPISQLGDWNENQSFAEIHTQSTRSGNIGDGGASGGLDDRFDMMLVSSSLMGGGGMDILPLSYTAVGNDGGHFNANVNTGFNFAVPDSIADALYLASDHLPVVANFVFGMPTSIEIKEIQPEEFSLEQNYPNPFNPTTKIKYYISEKTFVELKVYNLLGEEVKTLVQETQTAGNYEVDFSGEGLAGGVYIYRLRSGQIDISRKFIYLK